MATRMRPTDRSWRNLLRTRHPAGRKVAAGRGPSRRAASRMMSVRTRPQVRAVRVRGQLNCDICLGMIKEELPSIDCSCGRQYHNSCAARVRSCPTCSNILSYYRQKPRVVDSEGPVLKPMPLSKEDKLMLLEERFVLGEITEQTYLLVRNQVQHAPDTARFCSVCSRRLAAGEPCDCTTHERTIQCPECAAVISDEDEFCSMCGVVFSPEFSKDLYQCPECERVVSEGETACACGVVLVGEGNMICPGCGGEIPESSSECSVCERSFIDYVTECPACSRIVDKDAFACLCGVIFSDRVGGAECSLCNSAVGLVDQFCPKCGARFADELRLEGKRERKIKA